MDLSFTFRNTSPSDSLRDYVRKKIGGLMRLVQEPSFCHVVFNHEKFRYCVEIIVEAPRAAFRAKEEGKDMNSAFDLALDVMKRQARKFRDKRK